MKFHKGTSFVDIRYERKYRPAGQAPNIDEKAQQCTWHVLSDPRWDSLGECEVVDVVVFVAGRPTKQMAMSTKELEEYINQHNCQILPDSYPEEKPDA